MAPVTVDPGHEKYKVGPGFIELRHVHIDSLVRVSRGSWQPHLIYGRWFDIVAMEDHHSPGSPQYPLRNALVPK